MSDLSLSQEALDASNRVLGLLAGATSQSFTQIGYGVVETAGYLIQADQNDSVIAPAELVALESIEHDTVVQSALTGLLKNVSSHDLTSLPSLPEADVTSIPYSAVANALSPFHSEMDDQLVWSSTAQSVPNTEANDLSAVSLSDSALSTEAAGSFVSDLLSDLLERITTEESFEPELDGENQAAFRDFLDALGGELDGGARDFFQSNVRGQIKEITGDLIDNSGLDTLDPVLDPLQDFDYYGTSSNLIQDTRDALSLSSLAVPPIGPTVAWAVEAFLQR